MQDFLVYTCIVMQGKSCHYLDGAGGAHICERESGRERDRDSERRREREKKKVYRRTPGSNSTCPSWLLDLI